MTARRSPRCPLAPRLLRGSLAVMRIVPIILALPTVLAAQDLTPRLEPRTPPAPGFRVFVLADMEGMASVVFNREIIAGNEGERYRNTGSPDYWSNYRALLTREINAVIAGSRRGGARSFVVNEGHGGNLFGSTQPWDLDTAALLVRGWPKPMVMTTGLDSSFGALIMIGMHAMAGTNGVIAHTYAFDDFRVNGRQLNETGINALVAGEYGVPVAMVAGDDLTVQQAREQLGPDVVGVVTKYALSRSAAITLSPAVVRQMLADSAAVAVRRAARGAIRPFTMQRPYRIEFTLRRTYPQEYVTAVDSLQGFTLERLGERRYRFVTSDARDMARLLDAIELIVLR